MAVVDLDAGASMETEEQKKAVGGGVAEEVIAQAHATRAPATGGNCATHEMKPLRWITGLCHIGCPSAEDCSAVLRWTA